MTYSYAKTVYSHIDGKLMSRDIKISGEVFIEIDLDTIKKRIARLALDNRTHYARMLSGLIKAKATNISKDEGPWH